VFVRTAIAVLVAATIIKAGAAFAQTSPAQGAPQPSGAPTAGWHHRHHPMAIFRGLNLTGDQTAKIRAIQERYRDKNKNVTDRQERLANFKAERQEIMAVLTPDQRRQLQERFAKIRERRHQGEGRAPMPSPSP
jgi:Spy/CpxP family protein refolding chaperone